MNTIVEILMERDCMNQQEAEDLLADARNAVADGDDPEEVLADWFGLEPDYIFSLI